VIGEKKMIVNGGVNISQNPVWIEGPHLFKFNKTYYLICAEGGTSFEHSEVVFTSGNVYGPYVPANNNPILTQRDLPSNRKDMVACAGHADIVQTPEGDWWAVLLLSALMMDGISILEEKHFFSQRHGGMVFQ
jgi:alpha-N-arabinofuranosidase